MGNPTIDKILKGIASANAQADTIRDAYITRPIGSASDMHLRADIAPSVPPGAARPFAPGEYVNNPDGSWSSEVSMTVQHPKLNGGKATVIPSLWIKNGKPYEAKNEDEAVALALASRLPFRSYKSMDEAERASIAREASWQPLKRPEDAASISPLWDIAKKAAR